ncbi:MAG: efflux RND transporter periplasmic adaptor subunit [Methylocystis sp.]|jgi:membrane fusion protein (multidrug efflux system)|nr:efflux RND transporter periplasmic adaptor subunit [Methylocystis sp.]MCA3585889.1 efflux RND transporter periplasmic adaptor subunit [Methylocystis sp.]MCA3586601.1 efflux RND transporter periplasmic adaptor subunit [Methylocystis sp.]MCA3590879.1 efflux RND transporter periplasmic adaptor subunit [Methylocystis sp.]
MRWYGQLAIAGVLAVGVLGLSKSWGTVHGYLPEPVQAILKPLFPVAAPVQQAGAPRPGGGQAPTVEVAPVAAGVITEVSEAVGTTRAFESVVINSKVNGIVESISFTEGTAVRAGDELLRLDVAERRADWEGAQAAIAQEEAKRNELRTKLERAIQLRRTGAGTEALVEDLTAQVKTSDSAIQNALAKERAALARMNDMIVRAPFDGRTGIRQVSVGAFLETKTPITTLDDISKLRLDFQVPEYMLARVRPDAVIKASSVTYPDRKFDGRVAVIDTRIDVITRSVKLTAIVDNPDLSLRPGMFMTAFLEVAKRTNTPLISEEALLGEGPLQIAFAVIDNKVERRIVKVGQRENGKVEILEGLKIGEMVVVRGIQRVRSGMTVNARPLGTVPLTPPAGGPAAQQRPQAQTTSGVNAAQAAPAATPGQPQTARP